MVKQAITKLHKTMAGIQDNGFVKDIGQKLGQISDQISNKIPNLIGNLDVSGHVQLNRLKKKLLKKLDAKRKKFRLALESLGWGGLANLLEAAFCGEKLNILI